MPKYKAIVRDNQQVIAVHETDCFWVEERAFEYMTAHPEIIHVDICSIVVELDREPNPIKIKRW